MPSLTVELEPGKTVHVKLVKEGYLPLEFDYVVPSAPATVTKTMVAVVCRAAITRASLNKTTFEPRETIGLAYTVKNTGNITTDIVIRFGIGSPSASRPCHDVPPGGSVSGSVGFTAPSSPGSYKIVITAEACGRETDRKELPFTVRIPRVAITFDTRKEDGTVLTGVEVWIDGEKKGTT